MYFLLSHFVSSGACPVTAPGTTDVCDAACTGDSDCQNGQICCSSDNCGNICKTPTSGEKIL